MVESTNVLLKSRCHHLSLSSIHSQCLNTTYIFVIQQYMFLINHEIMPCGAGNETIQRLLLQTTILFLHEKILKYWCYLLKFNIPIICIYLIYQLAKQCRRNISELLINVHICKMGEICFPFSIRVLSYVYHWSLAEIRH